MDTLRDAGEMRKYRLGWPEPLSIWLKYHTARTVRGAVVRAAVARAAERAAEGKGVVVVTVEVTAVAVRAEVVTAARPKKATTRKRLEGAALRQQRLRPPLPSSPPTTPTSQTTVDGSPC